MDLPVMSSYEKWLRRVVGWSFFHFLTGHKYLIAQKPDASTWTEDEHRATRWEWWPVPDAERCPITRSRTPVVRTAPVDWPDMFRPLTIFWGEMRPRNDGVMEGSPMQLGLSQTRGLSHGQHEWGRKEFMDLPLPARGWYWLRGHPVPSFDKHCTVVAPDGDVFELIQFNPDAVEVSWSNQAYGAGRWRDGVLIEGRAFTAARLPAHRFMWTPWSGSEGGHEMAIVLPDYVGGDGSLTSGPRCGMRLALKPDSASFRRMVELGGECAATARSLAEFGAWVIDANGYDNGSPRPPRLHRQAGRQWHDTNAHLFRIDLLDLVEAVP